MQGGKMKKNVRISLVLENTRLTEEKKFKGRETQNLSYYYAILA
jgi:hypothetical protein